MGQAAAHLSNGSILVLSGLHKGLLQCCHLVLQLLDACPDTCQLLVGGLELAIGLSQRGTLGSDNLCNCAWQQQQRQQQLLISS